MSPLDKALLILISVLVTNCTVMVIGVTVASNQP